MRLRYINGFNVFICLIINQKSSIYYLQYTFLGGIKETVL